MEKGAMLGALDDFQDRAYFDQRRSGTIMTDERSYELRLFAVCSAEANETVLFDPQGRTISEVLAFLRGKAIIYNEPTEGERIVALSTCSGRHQHHAVAGFGTIHEAMRGVHSMRTKKLPRIFIMLFCAFLFHMGSPTAYAAAESAEVRLPCPRLARTARRRYG